MQNLVHNAWQFQKESLKQRGGASIQSQKNIDWTTEMKIKLVKIDDEERKKVEDSWKELKKDGT